MKYVILNLETGKYVARGGKHAYTNKLQEALLYQTRKDAERDRCGNERILTLEQAAEDSQP